VLVGLPSPSVRLQSSSVAAAGSTATGTEGSACARRRASDQGRPRGDDGGRRSRCWPYVRVSCLALPLAVRRSLLLLWISFLGWMLARRPSRLHALGRRAGAGVVWWFVARSSPSHRSMDDGSTTAVTTRTSVRGFCWALALG
jgi:hypothetical protein